MKYVNNTFFKHDTPNKIGVLMINLGTPNQATPSALKTYLKQFLSDPRVVEVPRLLWFFILNCFILPFRSKRSAKAYQSVWQENGSPLLIYSKSLVSKVASKLPGNYVVELGMRYGSPSVEDAVTSLRRKGATQLLIIPLYPQYSATTTASTFDAVAEVFRKLRYVPEMRFINHYHDHPLFIDTLTNSIKQSGETFSETHPLILSYHGIPQRYWDNGDPYPCHCLKTSRLVKEALNLKDDAIKTTFQSRFGREEWVKPYTDETLKLMPETGVKNVTLMCPGFAVDCLETIEEIEQENKDYFMEAGGQSFSYIPCLNDSEQHAEFFVNLIKEETVSWQSLPVHESAPK